MRKMSMLAEHIIAVANEDKGRISNLQLQKVMYFIIGDYIQKYGIDNYIQNIYDEKMEAWQYGPVLRSEYFKNNIYGSMKIRREVQKHDEFEAFDSFIKQRIYENIGDLIDKSHEHKKWKSNESKILTNSKNIYYELEDLQNEFSA